MSNQEVWKKLRPRLYEVISLLGIGVTPDSVDRTKSVAEDALRFIESLLAEFESKEQSLASYRHYASAMPTTIETVVLSQLKDGVPWEPKPPLLVLPDENMHWRAMGHVGLGVLEGPGPVVVVLVQWGWGPR